MVFGSLSITSETYLHRYFSLRHTFKAKLLTAVLTQPSLCKLPILCLYFRERGNGRRQQTPQTVEEVSQNNNGGIGACGPCPGTDITKPKHHSLSLNLDRGFRTTTISADQLPVPPYE